MSRRHLSTHTIPRAGQRRGPVGQRSTTWSLIDLAGMPSLRGGTCTDPRYRAIVDESFTTETSALARQQRQRGKDLCAECPVFAACRRWTQEKEEPAGSWGGIYAGQDAMERQGKEFPRRPVPGHLPGRAGQPAVNLEVCDAVA